MQIMVLPTAFDALISFFVHICKTIVKTTPFSYLAVYGPVNGFATINRKKAIELVEDAFVYGKFPDLPTRKTKPKILYATGILLTMGSPDDGPRLPTWREFFQFFRLDWNDPENRARFFEKSNLWDPYSGDPEPQLNLDREIHGDIMDVYNRFDFTNFLNPKVTACRYLLTTPFLYLGKLPKGEVVGEIEIIEKNKYYDVPEAWARDRQSLACLQYCLNRIGETVRIEVLG